MMSTEKHFLDQSLISQNSNDALEIKKREEPITNKKSFLSSLFFTYIYSFLQGANKNGTSIGMMPPLSHEDQIQSTFTKLSAVIEADKKNESKRRLAKHLAHVFKGQLWTIALLVVVVSAMKMYAPFLCGQIISYVQQRKTRGYWEGIALLGTTILLTFFKSVGEAQLNYRLSVLGVSLSSNLSLMIFQKSLKYPLLRQKEFSASDIINYSQVDCQRMTYLGNQLSSLLATPLQLIIGIIIMWMFIGISFLSGLVATVFMIWITLMVSKCTIKFNGEVLKAKDGRMKVTQQILQNIRSIKVNGLESVFLDKVHKEREKELSISKKKAMCEAIGYFLYWLTCPMILIATFTTYLLLGNEMTSQAAFTTIMIFSILQYPIRQLPTSISEILQIATSLKRIEKFLLSKEINQKRIHLNELPYEQVSITINQGNFLWKKERQETSEKKSSYIKVLKNVNVAFKRNKLTMVIGRTGCGKSSLLLAILNEMKCQKQSRISVNGKVAFCSQTPWILSDTVRNNIILFSEYNEYKFEKAIYYSGLEQDLSVLPKGDLTEIGEKGMNISGGQKSRISLARALYADSDIYLLDDILSSVDVNTADFLMNQTIKKHLKDKTIILITHKLKNAKLADDIMLLKKGKVLLSGKSQNVIKSKEFQQLRREESQEHILQAEQPINQQLQLIKLAFQSKKQARDVQKSTKIVEELMIPEEHQQGEIKLKVFKQYIDYNGGMCSFALVVILAMLFWILSTTFASIFMSFWCSNPQQFPDGLYIYAALSLSSSVFILIRASVLILAGVKQGEKVHRLMINALLKASLIKFYNRVPIGRIVNRLTKDLRELDEAIGPAIGGLLVCAFQMLGTIAICIYSSSPYLLIPTACIAVFCWKVKNYYLNIQREVTRLQKITNTPIVNGFISTLRGLESVRAYRLQSQLLNEQISNINKNKRVRTVKQALESWFALNLTYLSFFVNIISIAYCILDDSTDAAVVGLLITYALNFSSDINLTILCYAYFETKVISLERIYEFTQIEPEERENEQTSSIKIQGQINFADAYIKYREDLPNILQGITITINEGEKIGIAGRSGSGKTTILNALLRVAFLSNGDLLLDGIPINKLSVNKLRTEITVIDQEPFIIKGSIRDNLDIYNQYTDEQIIEMLQDCEMHVMVQSKGGLKSQISKESLSAGEKQMLCICRALLRKAKIMLIDQATASIDEKSDSRIQEMIRQQFKSSTVLTIAHRLQTLSSSDKILILDDGKVLQFGTPTELRRLEGAYCAMLKVNSINI